VTALIDYFSRKNTYIFRVLLIKNKVPCQEYLNTGQSKTLLVNKVLHELFLDALESSLSAQA
jgi:hypothetical protein